MKTKEELKALLRESVCEVLFIKMNGEHRTMICTLKADLLPPRPAGYVNTKPENPDVVPVFDLENNGWRSFRVDSVISIK